MAKKKPGSAKKSASKKTNKKKICGKKSDSICQAAETKEDTRQESAARREKGPFIATRLQGDS
jgi:hypothetical protein